MGSKKNKAGADTIAAIATPLGEGGIGIIRLSGPDSLPLLASVFRQNGKSQNSPIESHRVYHGHIVDPNTKRILDEAVVSYMKAPLSYTGEDCIEISCHGGIAILTQALEAALAAGARLAERGEFTKRAFLNGKIDLAQAEAVIDLIKAKTKAGVYAAADQLEGRLSSSISDIRNRLLALLARIEASIDFPDDVEEIGGKALSKGILEEKERVDNILETADAGKVLKEGLPTAIVGKPNVGKSSILNALLKEERAIVTEIPGTTRDTIEEVISVKGLPLRIVDTAGMRIPRDRIEELGIKRTKKVFEEAELSLIVFDVSEPLTEEDIEIMRMAGKKKAILVANKIDKVGDGKEKEKEEEKAKGKLKGAPLIETSALYGDGIALLEDTVLKIVSAEKILASDGPIITNARHKESLLQAGEALSRAGESAKKGMEADFIAIDIKGAAVCLGEVTGEEASEEVIDRIFSEFCVGK